ncbi:inorganic pyrophosphatase, partial [Ascosphaera pollenicola]
MGSLFNRVSFDESAKKGDGPGNTGTPTSSGTSGGLFGSAPAPATTTGTGLFGSAPTNTSTTPAASSSLFGGNTQNNTTGTTPSLFGSNATNNNTNQQNGQTRDLFAHITNKPGLASGLGSTTANNTGGTGTGSLFPNIGQSQQQGPSLSTFGDKPLGSTTQQTTNNTVQGVKIDISNLVPTTKFDACSPELQNEIEKIDNMIQNQIKMCHEVSDLFPSITSQVTPIPTDVEFVENKLETLQEALEVDAAGIEAQRNTVENDAAEAKLAF